MASTTTGPRRRARRGPRRRRSADAERASVESYRLTPKLAKRVALLGALVVIGFAALLMRLWALQVLAGSHYAAQAQANQVRKVRVQAPRGPILDSSGRILVTNKPVTSVELSPAGMPKVYSERAAEVRRIAHVARVSVRHVTKLIVAQKRRATCSIRSSSARKRPARCGRTSKRARRPSPGLTLARSYIRTLPRRIARGAAARLRRPDPPRGSEARQGRLRAR